MKREVDKEVWRKLVLTTMEQWPLLRMVTGDSKVLLALPYILGAEQQVDRYVVAYEKYKANPTDLRAVSLMMHEISCLVEDLDTIVIFMKARNYSHEMHKLWKEVRRHVRHDLRDESPTSADVEKTQKRALYLGFRKGMLSEIVTSRESIRFGEKTIELQTIRDYIAWVMETLEAVGPNINISNLEDEAASLMGDDPKESC